MRLQLFPGVLIVQLVPLVGWLVSAATVVIEDRDATPSPIVVAPSQNWDGDDGSWSSFPFQVGTPAQNVRLLISTSLHQTSVVLPEGCIASDPKNCADSRGGEFQSNTSSTWVKNTANLSSDIYPLGVGSQFGYSGKAALGADDITLGWQGAGGPTLKNQTLAGIATKDTYLGLFGLTPRASNFTTFNDPIPSFMQNLRTQSLIPSLSWGYTAGNQYRLSQVLGSLTLGGYDKSRFISHDVTWGFNSQDIRDLTVQITSITSNSKDSETSLLSKSIPAFLDSSLPYIWLPVEVCTQFEKAFNLTWDKNAELYLLTDDQHDALTSQNPNITFTLGNLTPGVAVNITLPYAAFDLTLQPPFVTNSSKYFPLKQATNSTQYTLGRTFFQEAYVIADYDRGNFSVSQCSWVANAQQDIVAIAAPSSKSSSPSSTGNGAPSSNSTSSSSPSKKSTPVGAIAGGVVGGIAAAAAAAFLIFYFCIRPRRRRAEAAEAEAAATAAAAAAATAAAEESPPTPNKDPETPADENTAFIKPELDAESAPARWEMDGNKDPNIGDPDAVEAPTDKTGAVEAPTDQTGAAEAPTDQTGAAEAPTDQTGAVEADGQATQIHEMPAREEVAAELMGQRDFAVEMAGSTRHPNPRFSFVETPIDMQPRMNLPSGSSHPSQPSQPSRWSWATSAGGDTLVGSSEKDPLSPLPPLSPQITAPSPQSAATTRSENTEVSEPSPQSARPRMDRVPE